MGLLLLAIRLGRRHGTVSEPEAEALRVEIRALASHIEATIEMSEEAARRAAEACADARMMIFLGSGPSYGTALFSAAKQAEAPNRFAVGQDLEEWHHVERLAYPADMPTFIIAPVGRSRWRALDTAGMAVTLGRRVVVIAQEGDDEMARHGEFLWPVRGEIREAFSPLLYHIGADLFASYLTRQLGRMIFQRDHPAFRQLYEGAS
jgi:glucosamine--fructose-6-phosphate aminotransferase (isomerizing)